MGLHPLGRPLKPHSLLANSCFLIQGSPSSRPKLGLSPRVLLPLIEELKMQICMIGCLKLVCNASCREKSCGLKLWVCSDTSNPNPHHRVLPALFRFYAGFSFSCSYTPGSQEFRNIYSSNLQHMQYRFRISTSIQSSGFLCN